MKILKIELSKKDLENILWFVDMRELHNSTNPIFEGRSILKSGEIIINFESYLENEFDIEKYYPAHIKLEYFFEDYNVKISNHAECVCWILEILTINYKR